MRDGGGQGRFNAAVLYVVAAVVVATPVWASRSGTRVAAAHASKAVSANLKNLRHVVLSGQTLTAILQNHGLRRREVAQWDAAMQRAAGPGAARVLLAPDHVLTLQFDKPGRLAALNYEVDDHNRVIVERDGKQLRSRLEPLSVKVTVVGAQGIVEKNFHLAARSAGIPDRVISQMADILGWEFDFRSVRRGDRFRVVYERRVTSDGRVLSPGKVLAAEIRTPRRTTQAFYYDDGVEGTYVDDNGRVLAQSFLRYPVEFTRISSVYSHKRFHPILHYARAHHGVDFAAPPGTPVRAAGDGVVEWAGRNGDYGNHVAIKHGDGWVTTYSHLRGVARGLHPGMAVRQGQVIGWVGQTGLATGPHLHFALFRNGAYLNPLTASVSFKHAVRDPHRFQLAKADLLQHLANVPRAANAAPAEPIVLAALPPARRQNVVSLTQ